ncbi:MAG TPA: MFS transporter [Blastocatellia bacterium]|nr:MFS transporter [Blastocatellia bacterium]HMX26601.1 MFS transporter [Blastocatellia bacterium]HMY74202.1 MFS transporter [Blastocatellia bacterium]HMZ18318.1 MFS transporter [Blastocatellia bacterium]HNG31048.1 MFS transporter [Blastocatellia bacterium]
MTTHSSTETSLRLTPIQWLICVIAVIGFAFDTYELLMLPLVLGPAVEAFSGLKAGTPEYGKLLAHWRDLLFYVPAVCGGIFGLLGGYLTDRLGRRRVLTWSILVYAFSALAAGFSTSLPMLLTFRCTTFVGVCVEFVAAVAWLAELFPNPTQREKVLGYTQAFSSLGGVMVSGMAYLIAKSVASFPAIYGRHENWRYLLISGLIPAIPLMVIRPFLPESPVWAEKKAAGTLKRPSIAEIFQPAYRKTTIVTALMFACSLGVAFGAIQQLPQIVPGLPEVAALPGPARQPIVAAVQWWQEIGGLVGRFVLAGLALVIISRRWLIRFFQIPGLIVVPLVFLYPAVSSLGGLKAGIFFAGLFTVAQLSFWGNYLPRVYPTHLRGTGESFAANVGGRMIGTAAVLLTTQLTKVMPGNVTTKLSYAAATVAGLIYALGLVLSFFLPEPQKEDLPE